MGPFHFAVGKITWWDYLDQHCGCPPPWSPFGPLFANKEARPTVTVAGYRCIQKRQAGLDSPCAKTRRWKYRGSLKKASPRPNRCGNFQHWVRRPRVGQPFALPTAESLKFHTLPIDRSASLPLPFPIEPGLNLTFLS